MNRTSSNGVGSITIETLDYENKEELDKIYDFLNNSNKSVIQQYPLIKCLYVESNQIFYYLYCKQNNTVIGILSFVVFINKIGNIIQSNPMLGYGGIVCDDNKTEEIFILLIDKMVEIAKQYNCISVTIGTSILDSNLQIYKKILKPDFIKENFYQYNILDDIPINKLSSKRRGAIKSEVNKSIKNNIKIIKNDHKCFDEWYQIYSERLYEIKANILPYDFLKNISYYFTNKNVADFYYVVTEEELIGGTLIIYNRNVMDYFATSFKAKYMNLNSGQYVLTQIHEHALEQNIKIFNWESSPSKDGGVYKFKKRWGAVEGNHYYLTKIVGNIETLKGMDINLIKSQYKGYYLMPYEVLK